MGLLGRRAGHRVGGASAARLRPGARHRRRCLGRYTDGSVAASQSFDTGAGNALFALGFSASFGVARAFPDMLPESSLNDNGRAAIESLKDGCVGQTTDGSPAPDRPLRRLRQRADPFDTPGVRQTAPLINLPQPGKAPTANLFVYHAINDQLVPVAGADAMVDAYCAAGTPVHYNRSPNGEHVLLAVHWRGGRPRLPREPLRQRRTGASGWYGELQLGSRTQKLPGVTRVRNLVTVRVGPIVDVVRLGVVLQIRSHYVAEVPRSRSRPVRMKTVQDQR